jgi:hypothetical protein
MFFSFFFSGPHPQNGVVSNGEVYTTYTASSPSQLAQVNAVDHAKYYEAGGSAGPILVAHQHQNVEYASTSSSGPSTSTPSTSHVITGPPSSTPYPINVSLATSLGPGTSSDVSHYAMNYQERIGGPVASSFSTPVVAYSSHGSAIPGPSVGQTSRRTKNHDGNDLS